MRRSLIVLAAILLGGIAAAAQVTVTPTLVSAQSGADLYCAARPLTGQIQVYCYATVATPWDTLRFNSVFAMGDGLTAVVPDITKLDPSGNLKAAIGWLFKDVGGKTTWQLGLNGQLSSGTF